MTTFYTETPTFEERVSAATLVILGRVEEVVDVSTDYTLEQPQVRTTFRVNIESVLKGRIDASSVHAQIAGGKTDEAETAWSVQLREAESALLMLSPNYANRAPEVFVPYFESVYPVSPEGNVELSEDLAKQLADQNIPVERTTATLADLRALVDVVARRQEEQEGLLTDVEPPDLRRMPYREVIEMPQPDVGGARSATPED